MKKTNTPASHILLVGQIAAFTSIAAFSFYLRHSDLLLYGDAVAHINIARRVFDSRTPGLLQLGTVWLPLPHLLMLPFLTLRWLWQSGVGGSIPSLFAYVLSVIGIFRLVQSLIRWLRTEVVLLRAAAARACRRLEPSCIHSHFASGIGELGGFRRGAWRLERRLWSGSRQQGRPNGRDGRPVSNHQGT